MKKRSNIVGIAMALLAGWGLTACTGERFQVQGTVSDATDSTLYLEHMSLGGAVKIDSVKLKDDGLFSFKQKAPEAPEFYRLRIGTQIVNFSVDSTETVSVKASYPTMASQYEIEGSDNCQKIKELTLKQMQLQAKIQDVARDPSLGITAVGDSAERLIEAYKDEVKRDYIFKEPMKAYAYFALFQTIYTGGGSMLLFNPRTSEEDIKVFAAVATSWDTYYPGAERGENLHNIAIQGLKDQRIVRNRQNQTIDASQVDVTNIIDIALPDNHGTLRRLSDLKGKVVMLDFHLFASNTSTQRIMQMRDLYNKYRDRGFEIYQVAYDPDEHFWKTKTEALPWVSVFDADGLNSVNLLRYNVQSIPTFFLIGKDCSVHKRDAQISDLDAEIGSLL
ncbi:MAG: AhpC/TSA family protein [Prevotella sp.]|nr:AhpC/TSA family protein [Prevotella sp.]